MSSIKILSLLSTLFSVPNCAALLGQRYSLEHLSEFEGLRFEEIGKLRAIVKTSTLTFEFNISNLTSSIDEDVEKRYLGMQSVCQQNVCETNSLKMVKEALENFRRSLGKLKRQKHSRSKRFLMTDDQGKLIEKDISNIIRTQGGFKNVLHDQFTKIKEVTNSLNENYDRLANQTMMHENNTRALWMNILSINEQFEVSEYIEKFKAIQRVMVNKRLDIDVVSAEDFSTQLKIVADSINGSQNELPFKDINDYYLKIKTHHHFENGTLTVKMDIPIIAKEVQTLYKIEKIPTRVNDQLVVLETQWSYLANSSKYISTFASLEMCYNPDEALYLCEVQSPLHPVNSDTDCLTKVFRERKIVLDDCNNFSMKHMSFSQLTFIKKSEGKYFYLSQQDEKVQIVCNGEPETVELTDRIGIITMSSGCVLIAKQVTLFVTGRKQEAPVVLSVINVTFDEDDFKEKVQMGSMSTLHLYESIEEVKPPADTSSIHILPAEFKANGFFGLAAACIGVILLLSCICSCCRSSKK